MPIASLPRLPALAALAVAGIASVLTALPLAGADAAAKPLKLAFLTNNASDFWTIARAGCEKAVQEDPSIHLDFLIPGDGSATTQKRYIEDLLAKGEDGIAISPIDPANQTDILNEAAKQSLLICQDSDAPASDRTCYVGTNNVSAGRQAGEEIKRALPQGGKIMVFVGSLDAQNARDRLAGIKEALAGSKVEIIDTRTDDADRVRAQSNAQDAIVAHADLACLVGLWSYNGPALLNAVKQSGKAGQVKIVCFDEEDETLSGVRDGIISATIVQQPYQFGYQAITLMARIKRGQPVDIPASKQVIVPTLAITKDSVDAFAAKLKQLRGK